MRLSENHSTEQARCCPSRNLHPLVTRMIEIRLIQGRDVRRMRNEIPQADCSTWVDHMKKFGWKEYYGTFGLIEFDHQVTILVCENLEVRGFPTN